MGKFKLYKLPIRLNNSGHSSLESIIAVKTCSTTDIDLLTFEKLERNGLPKGCILHKRTNGKLRYEFIHPSGNFLGGSVDFNKALEKAIKNTTDSLYKSYLIKKWQKI